MLRSTPYEPEHSLWVDEIEMDFLLVPKGAEVCMYIFYLLLWSYESS